MCFGLGTTCETEANSNKNLLIKQFIRDLNDLGASDVDLRRP